MAEFQRKLNLFDGTAIVTGSMIGSGIFIVSADIARSMGSPGWLLLVWLVSGILTIFAAVSYGELASLMPNAGGQYIYLRDAYNPLTGFLYGWAFFLVVQGGTIAAVAMAFGKFTGVLIPWFSDSNILFSIGAVHVTSVHLLAIASIIFLTWLNTFGISEGKFVQNLFTGTKVLVLLVIIVAGFLAATNAEAIQQNLLVFWDAQRVTDSGPEKLTGFLLLTTFGTATVGALFSLDAWNNVTFAAGEVIKPKRTVPLSLIWGTVIVSIIYLLVNIVYILALPVRGNSEGSDVMQQGIQFAADDRVGTAAMQGMMGTYAAILMAVLVMISTFGCNNGMILSGARVYYAMANDGLFFKRVARLSKRGVPAAGLVLQGIWSILICLSGTYSDLLDYVVATVLVFYVLTIAGIFILRKKQPNAIRRFKTPGYPYIPLIYIVSATTIVILLLIYKPLYSWPGMIIILLGIPVYYYWKRSAKTEAAFTQQDQSD
jgi:APA family basic amino acid/polyamine antiporter